ncbi:MAG: SagB/ThcOx family dehydrogenase [Dehalococcoidia bacterium]|nr:SagB/ThcOx family dehydrogenase [Dehalococcoidia bacterium]
MKQIMVRLPPPHIRSNMSLEETVASRRSVRRYRSEPLTLPQLSQVLWSAQGITGAGRLRAAPSAGATYPLEISVAVGKQTVEGLEAGVYHYEADTHSITLHQPGDLRLGLARAALDEGFIAAAPVDIVICALYARTSYRYGRRGERYVHMEVGHVGQNIHLQAVALDLATVEVGAFDDEEVRKVLGLEEQIKPLYIMPIGKPW